MRDSSRYIYQKFCLRENGMSLTKQEGDLGEAIATKFLKKSGYKILELNYRTPLGEIDIIAKDKETIVFVEVKTRSSKKFGLPGEAVNYQKQRHIRNSALYYLKSKGLLDKVSARFDVISILMSNITDYEIEHLQNAF